MKERDVKTGEKVLVLGAGQLGAAVLDYLIPAVIQHNGAVSVIVSPGSRDKQGNLQSDIHQKLADAGAKFISVDVAASTIDALKKHFADFDTIINCMGFVAGAGTQIKITRAVLESGVSRYFPWQFGVNYDVVGKGSGQPVWDEQYDVRTLLREQSTTEWVIVSTGMFTSFLFEPAFDVVNLSEKTINALGGWGTQVTVTSPADIGRLTTEIYLHQPRIANEVVFVAGETTSYGKLAETVERITKQTFARNVLTLPDLLDALHLNPDDQMLRYRAAFARGDGMWWPMNNTWNAQNNVPTQNIESWLKTVI
ncbi:TPA: aromatic alcohol reductase [Salmonella enterica]|uniref:Aromatic alcohol reductase n=1 Tax=Salmonella enterica subsp. arizonae TaxID=59203 RepID=A0A5Y2QGT1_SALER|nr:aromatic alcohol reductase [Salmonella enterica]EBH9036917.1 aromatic alcohol reductase [Salmonella enterica subsp. indica serovar 11:b:e,n,x]ECF4920837.1 aromatic alcohol reductase [Salmonella enterica subsp. arizonae]HAE8194185.1 aromatic alcohol reductase [Salmonella enterica subsp. indica serovar 41:b:1,7]HAU3218489.1 aromatic alcohol reductase [Salmonella enterica subsp. indica]ECI9859716.1 aromatic alcohol reductase [Salmonella enterica subsp. arizonae]